MKARLTLLAGIVMSMTLLYEPAEAQQARKPSAADVRTGMRMLWEDHIVWTRNVILNILDDLPGTTEAVNRLLQNQDDIGNAIKPYYGEAAGNSLATLLREHITIAATLLTALKTDNTTAFNAANTEWVANADAIAAFLSAANPAWPLAEMKTMMHDHLNLTAAEAVARKTRDYPGDIAAYDNIHRQILEMADMLAEGIVEQFPNRFSGCPDRSSAEVHSLNNTILLHQNTPNPVMSETTITYYVPETVKQAQMIVYDGMGNVVKRIDIRTRGEGRIVLDASSLRRGIYRYSILADDKLADTKTMIR